MISVHLRDIDPGVVAAWGAEFGHEPSVAISCGDIFEQGADAIVSPANSFGFMDGGIDLVCSPSVPGSIRSLLVPGFGTGIGGVPPQRRADSQRASRTAVVRRRCAMTKNERCPHVPP